MSAVVVAVIGAAAIAAGRGAAAPTHRAHGTSAQRGTHHFAHAELEHGVLTVEGTAASDTITLRLQAGRPDVLQVDLGDDRRRDRSFKRKHIARIVVDAEAGDDVVSIDDVNGTFTDSIPTTLDGGAGNDRLSGGAGVETLLGGDGNDSVDGNGGNDPAQLGAGDDRFFWDPGDGSDTIEGQDGTDTMVFNGAGGAEQMDLSANGNRLRFFRTQGTITMDTAGVEQVDVNALGGADTVTVNDLAGTDVKTVNANLAAALGGTSGDGATDQVIVNATNGDDTVDIAGDATGVTVTGLAAQVAIQHQEPTDKLTVNGLAGTDVVETAGLAAGAIQLLVDGVLVP